MSPQRPRSFTLSRSSTSIFWGMWSSPCSAHEGQEPDVARALDALLQGLLALCAVTGALAGQDLTVRGQELSQVIQVLVVGDLIVAVLAADRRQGGSA